MAQYINQYHSPENKLKILFIREGEGVYQFGTKKIYVAIHQEKIRSKKFKRLSLKNFYFNEHLILTYL